VKAIWGSQNRLRALEEAYQGMEIKSSKMEKKVKKFMLKKIYLNLLTN
jgi:hypothetical protein